MGVHLRLIANTAVMATIATRTLHQTMARTTMTRLARVMADRLRRRTESGESSRGGAFRPYSAAYARQKGVSRSNVTLKDTGKMLRALKVRGQTRRSFTVGVTGSQRAKAAAHHRGTGRLPARPWLGFTRDDKRFLINEAKDAIRKSLLRRGSRAR